MRSIIASVLILVLSAFTTAQVRDPASIESFLANGVHVPGSTPLNRFEPLQHRIAYAGKNGKSLVISWNTHIQLQEPSVFYGLTPGNINETATSNVSITYPTSNTWNNHVTLTNLTPHTKYYYKVSFTGCTNCAYLGLYDFTTARVEGDLSPMVVAVANDLGLMGFQGLGAVEVPLNGEEGEFGAPGETATTVGPANYTFGPKIEDANTIQSLLQMRDTYEFLQHYGDIAYADYAIKESFSGNYFGLGVGSVHPNASSEDGLFPVGTMTQESQIYESLLEQYYDQMTPITAYKPYMVSAGNHEANCNNGGITDDTTGIEYTTDFCLIGQNNFTGYANHFRMPDVDSGAGNVSNMWYSFNTGMVHWIALSSETDLGNGIVGLQQGSGPFGSYPNAQVDWLAADLAAVNRTLTPWVIVGVHRPWYVTGDEGAPDQQAAFEDIIYEGGVDMVLHGHKHFFNRHHPLYKGVVDPNGLDNPKAPLYIVNGAAGHWQGNDVLEAPIPDYVAVAFDDVFGWSRLTFLNRTHMQHEFVASRNNTVLDSAILFKEHLVNTTSASPSSGTLPSRVPAKVVLPPQAKGRMNIKLASN